MWTEFVDHGYMVPNMTHKTCLLWEIKGVAIFSFFLYLSLQEHVGEREENIKAKVTGGDGVVFPHSVHYG